MEDRDKDAFEKSSSERSERIGSRVPVGQNFTRRERVMIGKKMIIIGLVIVIAGLLIHFEKNLDFFIQKFFYSADGWMLKNEDRVLYFILYDIPRFSVVLALILSLGPLFTRAFFGERDHPLHPLERDRLMPPEVALFIGMLIYIGIIVLFKKYSGQPCPDAFAAFNGILPNDVFYLSGARCFPAGHSSAGFVWMLLGALTPFSRLGIWFWLAFGSLFGWITGNYQMLRGLHFMSDTMVSFGLAILFLGVLTWLLRPAHDDP